MEKQLRIRAKAFQDLDERCRYIAQFNVRAATRFKANVYKTFQFLLDFPESGSLCEYERVPVEGLRFITVKKYKRFVVVFRPIPDGVEIVRIFYGSQDIEGILRGDSGD